MRDAPPVIVFDVNETLSNMAPMIDRFEEVGAPGLLATAWFAGLLRDGFALTAAGSSAKFAAIANGSLQQIFAGRALNRTVDEAVDHIMEGFTRLCLHPDVAGSVSTLAAAGFRLITLSNGSTEVAERLFSAAGIRHHFEMLLSVEDAPGWKPLRAAYEYAAQACGVRSDQMLLTAVHPWDIDGAARAGLRTAWINRSNAAYPQYFTAPEITASSLDELAAVLGSPADSAR